MRSVISGAGALPMAPSTAASMFEGEGSRTAGTAGALGARAFAIDRALCMLGALGARAFAIDRALDMLGALETRAPAFG